uniref:Reverse transcriptase domain-containing protein n=1 Tax=Scylla olivacea TaxID=85551 RepID=A0A0P4VWF1_SCYOL
MYKRNAKTEAKNYSPVSLLPTLSKVLESVVHLKHHHLLNTKRYSLRQGRSAGDLHLLLTSEWITALDQRKATAVVALDIEGAFDRVWHAALLSKRRTTGVDEPLQLSSDYLSERQRKVNGRSWTLSRSEQEFLKEAVLAPCSGIYTVY